MQDNIAAGIVLVSRFVQPGAKAFQEYIDYIDREEAVRNDNYAKFSLYNDYMDNSEKTSALFTADSDKLDSEEKSQLKRVFEKAQDRGSMMWQNVISFDNRWLHKHGLYNEATGTLDEKRLMQVARAAMTSMTAKENMQESLLWSAAIHYNTDNVHIHIAAVEPSGLRKRGLLKPKTLEDMKSTTYGAVLDRQNEYSAISHLIRTSIVGSKREQSFLDDRVLRKQFLKIYSLLPPDKRLWQYNMNHMAPIKPEIDKLSQLYIHRYHKQDFEELQTRLSKEQILLQEAFGDTGQGLSDQFVANRIQDLYTRMGNTILKELKSYDRTLRETSYQNYTSSLAAHRKLYRKKQDITAYCNLKKALKKDFESIQNQNYYAQLMNEMERN